MKDNASELSFRHEIKYRIDRFQYDVLRRNLAKILKPDPHMGTNDGYHVRSLYFDDYRNTAFWDKQAGVYERKKYRIRIYNRSDSLIKFERKSKIKNFVLKEATRINREEAERITAGEIDFLTKSKDRLLKEFYRECRCNLLRPVLVVEYNRVAYFHPIGNVRVTFDSDVRMSLGPICFFEREICTMGIVQESDVILELKFNDVIPRFICGLFPDTIRPQTALGKFAMCREQDILRTGNPAFLPQIKVSK